MTNLNIAKLYLATNTTATAAEIDAAIADGSAATAVTALTGTALLNAIYQASFGRDADAEGIAYWTTSALTGDALITAINGGAAAYVANDMYPDNVAIAAADTTTVAEKTAADALAANSTVGAAAALIATVDTTTTAASLTEFTLEAGTATTTGSVLDDTISGIVSTLTSTKTLDATDVIDGGEGTDTLSLSATATFNGFTTGTGSMSNVENLEITNASALARTFNTTGITDLENISIDANNQDFTVNNLDAVGMTVDVSNSDDDTMTISYAAATATVAAPNAGSTDALTVNFSDVGAAQVLSATGAVVTAEKVTDVVSAGIETLNVASNGTANIVDLSVGTSTEVNVSGTADLKVTAVDATVTAVDASTTTGNMTLDLTAGTIASASTGSGDDTVSVTAIDVAASLAGGEGDDTLVITGSSVGTIQPELTGFETLKVDTLGAALVLAGSNTMDLSTLVLEEAAGGNNNITIAELVADSFTINLINQDGDTAASDDTITLTSAADLTVNTSTENEAVSGNFTDDIVAASATSLDLNIGSFTEFDGTVTTATATAATIDVADDAVLSGDVTTAAATALNITVGEDATLSGTYTAEAASSVELTVGTGVTATGAITAEAATNATITTGSDYTGVITLDAATTVSASISLAQTAFALDAAVATSVDVNSSKNVVFAATSDLSNVETLAFTGVGGIDLTTNSVEVGTTSASVNIDATNAKTAIATNDALMVAIGDYTAGSGLVTISGSTLLDNIVTIGTGRTEVAITTGIGTDEITFNSVFISGNEGVLTFDLGTTTTNDVLTLADVDLDFSDTTLTLTGVDSLIAGAATDDKDIVLNSSVITGKTMAIGDGTNDFALITIDGAAASANTINLSSVTVGADTTTVTINGGSAVDTVTGTAFASTIATLAGDDVITGGAGGDTITAGAGDDTITLGTAGAADTVNFEATATTNGEDTITTFVATEDILDFSAFATVTAVADADGSTNTTSAVLQAGVATDAVFDIANLVVMIDSDDYTDTAAIKATINDTTGSSDMGLADDAKAVIIYGDIDATTGGDFEVYYMTGATGATDTLTLVGTVTSDDLDAHTAADFAL